MFFFSTNKNKTNEVAPKMKKANRFARGFILCILLVTVLIGLAIAFYPMPYSWPRDFLSALGLTTLNNNIPNLISSILFNTALLISGIMSACYFCFRGQNTKNKIKRYLLWFLGIVSDIGLFGIGLFIYNIAPDIHNLCTGIAAWGIGSAIILCPKSAEILKYRLSEDILWILFGLFVAILWISLNVLRGTMLPWTPTAQIQQKIMIGFFWLYMIWNSISLFLRTQTKNI